MSPMIAVTLCALFVTGLLYAEQRENAGLKRLFKPAASLAFIAAGIAAGAMDTPFGQWILAGLILCALGDVLLIPASQKTFLAGMGAFAAGHAAYIGAFLTGGAVFGAPAIIALLAGALLAVWLVMRLRRNLGSFLAPIVIYSAIISVMTAASLAHWTAAPSPDSVRLAIAAAAFAVSDVSVAEDRFGKASFINRLWGLPLYYGAQCLFAISV